MGLQEKFGLIKQFDYSFQLEKNKVIELLTDKSLDKKVLNYEKFIIIGTSIVLPLNSNEIQFNESQDSFEIKPNVSVNLNKGYGTILGKVEPTSENTTRIYGKISSNTSSYKFIIYSFIVALIIISSLIVINDNYGFEFIIALIAFFTILILVTTLALRILLRQLNKAFVGYLERIK